MTRSIATTRTTHKLSNAEWPEVKDFVLSSAMVIAENLLCIVGSNRVHAVKLSREVAVFRGKGRRGLFRGIAEIRIDQKRDKLAT